MPVTDKEAIDSFLYLSRMEGIIPALESAHAIALARKISDDLKGDEILIVNLSGRGDKDVEQVARFLEGGHGSFSTC
jgi:tryptophan synthase beta chain